MLLSASSRAGEGLKLSGNGFLTAGAGLMLGGSRGQVNDLACPCFVSDYGQAGIYDDKNTVQWQPDTRLGLQGTAAVGRHALTGQVVARGTQGGSFDLDWLYTTWTVNDKLSLQLGRKRLPMFYYSDTQDVGYALPWTHLPPQLYGWEVVNYNGASLTWQDQWGDWAATYSLLGGFEHARDAGYWKAYRGRQNRTDVKWDDIFGGDLNLSKGGFETRLTYIQSRVRRRNVSGSWNSALQRYDPASVEAAFEPASRQQIYGLAMNLDVSNWLLRSEFIHINRPGENYKDFAQMVGVGYRWGRWQPMFTWANYRSSAVVDAGGDPLAMEAHSTVATTLRYALDASSDLKVQLDRQTERGGLNYQPRYGDSRLLSVAYDRVF